jgi:large subunit ribosomal protein L16
MGNGKGNVEYWAVRVRPGTVLYELERVDEHSGKRALRAGAKKLPIRTNRYFGRQKERKR